MDGVQQHGSRAGIGGGATLGTEEAATATGTSWRDVRGVVGTRKCSTMALSSTGNAAYGSIFRNGRAAVTSSEPNKATAAAAAAAEGAAAAAAAAMMGSRRATSSSSSSSSTTLFGKLSINTATVKPSFAAAASATSSVAAHPSIAAETMMGVTSSPSASSPQQQPSTTATTATVRDPFSIVSDELDFVSRRIVDGVKSQVPSLSSAAEYFFTLGSEGKRLRPTVILLLATALCRKDWSAHVKETVRCKQQRIAEITEMIHVASLLHDDVIDMASTRRGKQSLNALVGGKMSILAGDFLLARASVSLASLKNTEVIEVLSKVIEDLVTGEVMQLSSTPEQRVCFDFYTRKTYCKTASLFAKSCKAVAILGGLSEEEVEEAHTYGMHLGLAFQFVDDVLDFTGTEKGMGKEKLADLGTGTATAPVLFAAESFPELVPLIKRRFSEEGDVEAAHDYVMRSNGIERTLALAQSHSKLAADAVDMLPFSDLEKVAEARNALKQIASLVIERRR